MAPPALLEMMVPVVTRELLVKGVPLDSLDQLERGELMEFKEFLDQLDPLENQAVLECLVVLDVSDSPVVLEKTELLACQETKDPLVHPVKLDKLAVLDAWE